MSKLESSASKPKRKKTLLFLFVFLSVVFLGVVGYWFLAVRDFLPDFSEALFTGQTIYIANEGDDLVGDGSRQAPYKSVKKATEQANPGDRIYLKKGSYTDPLLIENLAGTRENYITISPDPETSNDVFIKASFLNNSSDSGSITLRNSSYIKIERFNIQGGNIGIFFDRVSNITISNNEISDTENSAIIGNGDNIIIANNIVRNSFLSNANWQICGQKSPCSGDSASIHVLNNEEISRGGRAEVRGNKISNSWRGAIFVANFEKIHVKSNEIFDTDSPKILIGNSSEVKIDRNYIYNTKEFNATDYTNDLAIEVRTGYGEDGAPHDIQKVDLLNNIIVNVKSAVTYSKGTASTGSILKNLSVQHNTFYDIKTLLDLGSLEQDDGTYVVTIGGNLIKTEAKDQIYNSTVWDIKTNYWEDSFSSSSEGDLIVDAIVFENPIVGGKVEGFRPKSSQYLVLNQGIYEDFYGNARADEYTTAGAFEAVGVASTCQDVSCTGGSLPLCEDKGETCPVCTCGDKVVTTDSQSLEGSNNVDSKVGTNVDKEQAATPKSSSDNNIYDSNSNSVQEENTSETSEDTVGQDSQEEVVEDNSSSDQYNLVSEGSETQDSSGTAPSRIKFSILYVVIAAAAGLFIATFAGWLIERKKS